MKKEKTRSALRTVLLFVLAGCLLGVGGIGAARAVPLIQSEYFSGGVEMDHIGVTLLENGTAISHRTYTDGGWSESEGELLKNLTSEGETFLLGKPYKEVISVSNSGTIDEFIRVTIYRYWEKDGQKITTLSPELIRLNLPAESGWVEDKSASSAERTVLYYTSAVKAGGGTTPFSDTLTVSGDLPYKVTQTQSGNVITTTYDYDGVTFHIQVVADAVQTHSGQEAVKSAWGRNVTVSGDRLSLG